MAAKRNQTGRRVQRIGKYEILAHIATGGMGAVYKAFDPELRRTVALKVLSPDLASKPNMVERFKREARSAARLRHDNIVAIYDVGEDNGVHYLALEFVDGVDLYDHISRKGKLSPAEARRILIQAARALDHAHKQHIVHRDIKPSNFLLSGKGHKLVVKLTDMGLARPVRDEEFRVTTEGTTVGTVDYMSPEQGRDSAAADIRSDIYSLGCTLFHMLAGKAPFAQGTLTERLFQHKDVEPPDIRTLNAAVPEGLVAILRKMLEKKPADRYQTPADLLHDLENFDKLRLPRDRAESLASLAQLATEDVAEPSSTRPVRPDSKEQLPARDGKEKPPSRTIPKPKRERKPLDDAEEETARVKMVVPMGVLVAVGMVVLAGLIVFLGLQFGGKSSPPKKDSDIDLTAKDNKDPDKAKDPEEKEEKPDLKPKPPIEEEKKSKWPPLFKPSQPLDLAGLRKEFHGPFGDFPGPDSGTVPFKVSRTAQPGPNSYSSLAEAIAAAAPDKQTVIDIHDQGPLFLPSLPPLERRNILIRAGPGFRPLLAWDFKPSPAGPFGAGKEVIAERLFCLVNTQLHLENLDVVARWNEDEVEGPVCLFQVKGGDFQARQCSFSIAGKQPRGAILVRLEPFSGIPVCRLSQCYARGANLVALDLQRSAGEVLFDRSLVVGGPAPLLRVVCRDDAPATVRAVRSTFVAQHNLLQVHAPAAKGPGLKFLAWDSLLARNDPGPTGALVELGPGTVPEAMSWRVVTCLYANWRMLLDSGGEKISTTSLEPWRKRWGYAEGDQLLGSPFPARIYPDSSDVAAQAYETKKTPALFAASSGDAPLGCDPAAIPAGPRLWLQRTLDGFEFSNIVLHALAMPIISQAADGSYHGERLDLAKIDLGQHLESRLKTAPPAARVVLHLTGQGERTTSPVRVKGIQQLVLYFEPGQAAGKPLTLTADPRTSAGKPALFDVEDGSLEMMGGRFRLENSRFAAGPRRLIQIKNGSLRLARCSLIGPMRQGPVDYLGLIDCQVGGDSAASSIALHESILVSDKYLLTVQGSLSSAKTVPMRVKQCVLVAGGDGIVLKQPAEGPSSRPLPASQVHLLWENNTLACAGSLLDAADLPPPAAREPNLVIKSLGNLFLAPFQGEPRQSALLRCRGDSITSGSLLWQGKLDAFDQQRLGSFLALADRDGAGLSFPQWHNLWGRTGEQQPFLLDLSNGPAPLSLDRPPPLDQLALPKTVTLPAGQPAPGADLERLGIIAQEQVSGEW